MRTIVFGDPNSIHTFLNLKEVMIPCSDEVVLASTTDLTNKDYKDFYKKHNITFHHLKFAVSNKLSQLFLVMGDIIALAKLGKFDLCVVHYLSSTISRFVAMTSFLYRKILACYWGSDLLRSDKKLNDCQEKLLKKANYILVGEKYMLEVFGNIFKNRYDEKIVYLNFFVNDNFKKVISAPRLETCKKFGLDDSKIIVMCGYNGSRAQNHTAIISSIDRLSVAHKGKIQVLLFMTYPTDTTGELERYRDELKELAVSKGLNVAVLKIFLTKIEMLELTKNVDIFLHFIKTDGFSGTLIEMLAGGAYIIKGEWLKYYELNECYLKNSDFDKLSADLEEAIDSITEKKHNAANNHAIVCSIVDNDKFRQEWFDFMDKAKAEINDKKSAR